MFFSPKTSADGLVFHYDTGNTVRSYLGEPTVNLLYSAGAYNLIDGATDIYGRCTRTDLGNGKYRFVNNGTGVSTVRVYTNQGDLINGATYACSVYYENLVGGIGIDWCDTGITGLNYSTNVSGRLGGYGTRGTYDGPYYFLDINFDSGGAVTLYNPQVEYKSHVTPFVAGTRSATQGLKDLTAANTINLSTVSFDANAQMTFDGTDDYINVPNGMNALVGTNQVTFSAWVRRSSIPNYWAGIISNKINAAEGIALLINPSSRIFFQYDSTSGVYAIDGGATLEINVWYNIVGIYDNVGLKTYLNGTLNDSAADAGKSIASSGNMDIVIGAHQPISSHFPGEIADVKIYNRALTTDEVTRNYNAIKSRFNIG